MTRWLLLASAAAVVVPAPAADGRRPNVVDIVSDGQGYGDLGVHGCKDIPTPHLDALATADPAADAPLVARVVYPNADEAAKGEPAVRAYLARLAELTATARTKLAKSEAAVFDPLLDVFADRANAQVKTDGAAVVVRFNGPLGERAIKTMTQLPAYTLMRRDESVYLNSLKAIGIAWHNYDSVYGSLPSDVASKDGKALLSWRVQLLPYFSQDALYRRFKLDEPWDSEHNKALIPLMPKLYEIPGRPAPEAGQTFLQSFVAGEARKSGNPVLVPGQRFKRSDVIDGLRNTIFVAEAADPVIWTKPADLPVGPGAVPKVGRPDRDRVWVVFGDSGTAADPPRQTDRRPAAGAHHGGWPGAGDPAVTADGHTGSP